MKSHNMTKNCKHGNESNTKSAKASVPQVLMYVRLIHEETYTNNRIAL